MCRMTARGMVGLVLLVSGILVGCPGSATVPLAPTALNQQAKAFTPPPGQALIYVIHEPKQTISWTLFRITLDGAPGGIVAAGTYLVFPVTPGAHRVTVVTPENVAEETLDMAAGQCVFVLLTRGMGWNVTRVGLHRLEEPAGRQAVLGAALAQRLP